MSKETGKAISYAKMLRRVAKRHDFQIDNFGTSTVTGQILHEDAAALRELARIVDEAERVWATKETAKTWGGAVDDLIEKVAAGFTPTDSNFRPAGAGEGNRE